MSFVHIKKIQKPDPATQRMTDWFAVSAVGLSTPQGKKLIPNPSGNEAMLFATLEEAEEAVRRAGFDIEYEGRKTYTLGQRGARELIRPVAGNSLDSAVPFLLERLKEREPTVVANAAFALGCLKTSDAVPALADLLGHDDPAVRKQVADALARIGAAAIPTLKDAYKAGLVSKNKNAPYIRLTVMNAYLELLAQGQRTLLDSVMTQIIEALNDESWLVRAQAALILGYAAQQDQAE